MSHFAGRTRCSPPRSAGFGTKADWIEVPRRLPLHEEIARLAYSYWEAGGRRDGRALEDWLRAERDLASPGRA